MSDKEKLLEKAKLLPATPGVYIMKNSSGRIIYVGKSKALKHRVCSYFAVNAEHYGKTRRMVNSAADFDVYFTETEIEALVLENQFIKQYRPRYNIKLKDSGGYPYIKITKDEYPQLRAVYKRGDDNCRYFGPFSSSVIAKNIIDTVKKTFRLPTCDKEFPRDISKARPCLNFYIGQCLAPCNMSISAEEYREAFDEASQFLKGDFTVLQSHLEEKMLEASDRLQFERAAKYRDLVKAVKKIGEKQHIVSSPDTEADVIGIFNDDLGSALVVFFVRGGVIVDRETFFFGADEILDGNALTGFIGRFYEMRGYIPKEIWLDFELTDEEKSLIIQSISNITESKFKLLIPKKGEKKELTKRAANNAKELTLHKRAEEEKQNDFLISLAAFLSLECVPQRIEAYDISNHGNDIITAGMVVIEDGKFCKKKYRSFNMKTVGSQDDYASLQEALRRRFSHADDDGWEIPDLILLDGGVQHFSVAKEILNEFGLQIPMFGMVKDEHHKTRTLTDGENDIGLIKRQDVFSFIYKIQEEVHRYALSRMDIQRRATVKKSVLEDIKGVGKSRASRLIAAFGGLRGLKAATEEQISKVNGINAELAKTIYLHLHSDE